MSNNALAQQAPIGASYCSSQATPYPAISTPTILPSSDPCVSGYVAGQASLFYNLASNLSALLPLVSSFGNLSWAGAASPITVNGSVNAPGTARVYTLADGARLVETLLTYAAPDAGPFVEVHSLAPVTLPQNDSSNASLTTDSVDYGPPAGSMSLYSGFDGMTVSSACGGAATAWNFTVGFCATDASAAEEWFAQRAVAAVQAVGRLLGGDGANLTTCATKSAAPARTGVGAAVSMVLVGCMVFAVLMV